MAAHEFKKDTAHILKDAPPIPRKTFTPIGCLVAIHVFPAKETAGGIVMPDNIQQTWDTPTALVIAVGPDCKWVKEGDYVLAFNNTAAQIVRHEGQKVLMLREDHLTGVILPNYRPDGK